MLDTSQHNNAVRTVLHMSPAVLAVAVVQSQQEGLGLTSWLDKVVITACAKEQALNSARGSLTDENTIELFANVVDNHPELLRGRWDLLYQHLLQDPQMWRYPALSEREIEAAADYRPEVNRGLLRKQWPSLIALTFGM